MTVPHHLQQSSWLCFPLCLCVFEAFPSSFLATTVENPKKRLSTRQQVTRVFFLVFLLNKVKWKHSTMCRSKLLHNWYKLYFSKWKTLTRVNQTTTSIVRLCSHYTATSLLLSKGLLCHLVWLKLGLWRIFAIFAYIGQNRHSPRITFGIQFEYFPNPWKIFARFSIFTKFAIFVRFTIFVNFSSLQGVPLLISLKFSPALLRFARFAIAGWFHYFCHIRHFGHNRHSPRGHCVIQFAKPMANFCQIRHFRELPHFLKGPSCNIIQIFASHLVSFC